MLGLDIAYLCTKFNYFRFSRSGDTIGAHQNLNGSRGLTTPFQGQFFVRRLGLAMINQHTKFVVSAIICNEDMKGNANVCKNSRFEPPFGGLRGNAQGSSVARWKEHCRLPISDN